MNKKWIYRIAALLIVVVIAVIMFIIGRGHTLYFDNVSIDYDGKTVEAPYKVVVKVKDEQVAKLYNKERGMTTNMGQRFKMRLEVTQEKDGDTSIVDVNMGLPYSIDGIVINLPALLAGAPQDVYLSEFVSLATEEVPSSEEAIPGDDFVLPDEGEGVPAE